MKTFVRWAVILGVVAMLSLVLPAAAQDDAYFPGAEWRTSTPEAQGMDSVKLLEALQYIEDEALPIDSLTVIRNGYVVLDAYYYPYTAEMKHSIWNITGSVVSALTGIAIEQGAIESLDVPMISLFPEAAGMEVKEEAASVTLGDFLSFHSGIACNDDLRVFAAALEAENAMQYRLETMFAPRRTSLRNKGFLWCDSNLDLVAGALQFATRQPLAEYAETVLFDPIGIQDYAWTTDQNGVPLGAIGLALHPHDLARFGYLYLRGGEWNGERIVPKDWVDLSTCADFASCPHKWEPPAPEGQYGVGYHWVSLGGQEYFPGGFWEQHLVVHPGMDTIIVMTRPYFGMTEQNKMWIGVIHERLIGAATADTPLPANAEANAQLQDRVARVAQPIVLDVPAQPEAAAQVSGQIYDLSRPIHTSAWETDVHFATGRPLDVTAFSIDFDDTDEARLHLYYTDGSELQLTVGLDNVWRMNETPYGTWAARGSWHESMNIFRVHTCSVGGENHSYFIRFAEDFVNFTWSQPEAAYMPVNTADRRATLRQ